MAGSWPPDGLVGDSSGVRMTLGMFGPEQYHCPVSDLLKASGLRPRRQPGRKPEALETFLNGPFMDQADVLERRRGALRGGRRRPVHDGVRQWTSHALRMYAEAFPDHSGLHPAPAPWVYQYRGPAPDGSGTLDYRISAWGRCFESADGRRRELRLPVKRLRARTPVERAIAALVAAEGSSDPRVERVRVVQFALADAQVDTLFEGTRSEAVAAHRADGAPAVRALLGSREYRPGAACAGCAIAPVCPGLERTDGLLGVADRSRPRRTWSSTTARAHRSCPARGYLRGLRLPVDDSLERGAAAERGRAIHAFLAARHGRRPCAPCQVEIPDDWVPEGFRLPVEERRLGALLLRHHAEVCPLRVVGADPGLRIEPKLAFDDTAADLVVLAEPDLLYQDRDGITVWRETKTSGSDRSCRDLFGWYPQLALAVRIIGAGILRGGSAGGRVELEVLQPGGVDLHILDPFQPDTRAAAEAALREQVATWHSEDAFEAVPGPECAGCEVARWCSARQPEAEAAP
ncbi:PD-(D/E)XK nuclease family protein [Streptacidiphilus sp. P02-A3a]|uniref:PD-(D/E)XK nuclease family protein n=1 Tax=Streptacidiphilus sp. P02-A3a TaxID=2704468 RepID=UPI0015F800AE|nr:PD-(D/E)XK nuclease family protein [Streptacidiphilus sp. P02-A3a]QMU68459.1 PD-(D/E)XK nuclease family protein [Streptacidiphilus sp. P02-A3a]